MVAAPPVGGPVKRSAVPAILARHGIVPEADAATLTAALEARGWQVTVEAVAGRRRGQLRYHALAHRPQPPADTWFFVLSAHRQARGRTAAEVLAVLLAKVLRGEEPDGAGRGA